MYDSFLSILAVVLIPVFIWWIRRPIVFRIKLFGCALILFFGQGSLELLGGNQTLIRYIFELPLFAYFFLDILKHGLRRTPGGMCIGLFMVSAIPSMVYTSIVLYILFMQQFLLVWVAFYCFYHARLDKDERNCINKLFIWLCVSQFFAAIFKYIIVGICEPYIGSMASHSGGLTTLFSLVGFTACAILYFSTKKGNLIWMCIGFILFGLIGEKRALVFMIPVSLFISFFVYSFFTRQFGILFWRKIIWGCVFIPILFYVMVRVNPSFNPQREVWGTFDLEYTINYVEKYNAGTLTKDKDNIGRSEARSVFHEYILNDNLYHILFGYGTGLLVQSAFNKETEQHGGIVSYSYNRWGIGYSMSIGYLKLLAQVGFVGIILYFMIYLSLLRGLYHGIKVYRHDLSAVSMGYGIATFMCIAIMIFLSVTYNNSSFILSPVSVTLMWLISYAYKLIYNNDDIFNSAV